MGQREREMVQQEMEEGSRPSDHGKTRCMRKEETTKKDESQAALWVTVLSKTLRLCPSSPGVRERTGLHRFSAVSENQTMVLERPKYRVFQRIRKKALISSVVMIKCPPCLHPTVSSQRSKRIEHEL